MPRVKRPPLTWWSVAAPKPTSPGDRVKALMTAVPSRTRSVREATAER